MSKLLGHHEQDQDHLGRREEASPLHRMDRKRSKFNRKLILILFSFSFSFEQEHMTKIRQVLVEEKRHIRFGDWKDRDVCKTSSIN